MTSLDGLEEREKVSKKIVRILARYGIGLLQLIFALIARMRERTPPRRIKDARGPFSCPNAVCRTGKRPRPPGDPIDRRVTHQLSGTAGLHPSTPVTPVAGPLTSHSISSRPELDYALILTTMSSAELQDFMSSLPSDHFLSLPRPDSNVGPPSGTVDTTTLAAHDFDVDTRTGFMPPDPPLVRLPPEWEPWEAALDDAISSRLQLGDKQDLSEEDQARSDRWRARVRELPILPTIDMKKSELVLRRAHHVLSWMMHFYIRTLPPSSSDIHIPPPITIPLLQTCAYLQLPPVLTYSDDVLYNWALKAPAPPSPAPALDNLRCLTLFTGTKDEEEFYLTSARIELRGVEALSLMRATMDEAFVGDAIAIRRITTYLRTLASVISDMEKLLLSVREGCDPEVFYNEIRPWFRGADSDTPQRKWVFEGLETHPELKEPVELSGPSAGQSSIIHALDIFLGVDRYSHASHITGKSTAEAAAKDASADKPSVPFLTRMQSYMPRHHRAFLKHLSSDPRPLRQLVEAAGDKSLTEAYNVAVSALKVFRDAHVRIVALYIVSPSTRGQRPEGETKGTGGTSAIRFVKSVRDQTAGAVIHDS